MTSRVVFARVSATEIRIEDCVVAVGDDAAGAIVTFSGVVRDHDGGRSVTSLVYEAHPSAGQVIAEVAAVVSREFDSVTIAVEHRSGALAIGDLALTCAVSSSHRAEAFAACARVVDRVKETVPIWKEQYFADGSTEWVGSLG